MTTADIVAAKGYCSNCSKEILIPYKPPVTIDKFEVDRENHLCPICSLAVLCIPVSDDKIAKTVLEVKRIHDGHLTVIGTIVSVSDMYVIKNSGTQVGYSNAKSIQLEDTEKPEENERLDVILYDGMISSVQAGEVVEIYGLMKIESKVRSKKLINILHSESIRYLNRKELVISDTDKASFHRFVAMKDLVERLVSMFAPNIIGHNDAKLGILRSIVGGVEHGKIRGRINTFLVGDPGTAKSNLAREAVEVKPNSRYVSGPHSSAKTITAIMDKENDSLVLRHGAIPLSRGAICAINEVTEFDLEDQARLLDVLEEGIIPLNKHGKHMIIPAPTSIIATANPNQSRWNDRQKVSNDEIPMLRTLLDRFDQIYPFRDSMNLEQTQEFVDRMNVIRKRKPHRYDYLKKYLVYASSLDVTMTPEAEYMLGEFWKRCKVQGTMSIRGYNSLYRKAEAQARLQLKTTVDAEIAKQVMESEQLMMVQYGETVRAITNPKLMLLNAFLTILENTKAPIEIKELAQIACKRDVNIASYLGEETLQSNNWKLREVIKLLMNHPKVRVVSQKPLVFQWLYDVYDAYDAAESELQQS
jgi:MCM P-loop domain